MIQEIQDWVFVILLIEKYLESSFQLRLLQNPIEVKYLYPQSIDMLEFHI